VIFGNGTSDLIKNILQLKGIVLLDEIKYLGAQIDSKLSFESYRNMKSSKYFMAYHNILIFLAYTYD